MAKVKTDEKGRLILPEAFLKRRHIPSETEYWLDEREGDLILHPCLPDIRKIYIQPTTHCNLHCRTCIQNVWDAPKSHMSMETYSRILESLDQLPKLTRVIFSGFGEPLSHPQILRMIQEVRNRGLAVTLGSNGLLLNVEVIQELIKMGVDRLVVSVDGVKPETYTHIRGAMLSQVLNNLRLLNDIKRQWGSLTPILGIEFVILKSNMTEIAELTGLASRLNADRILVSHVLSYTEEMYHEILYGYEPQTPLGTKGWPVKADAWVMWGTLDLPRMHWGAERRCRFVHDRAIVIGWDGALSPCYALSQNYHYFAIDGRKKQVSRYVLGNVHEQSLAEVWMSEEFVRFRSEVIEFRFPSCPDCDLRESCDLRGRNEGCWGWNPSCSDCLWAQDIIRCP